jgi:hypothetical protein
MNVLEEYSTIELQEEVDRRNKEQLRQEENRLTSIIEVVQKLITPALVEEYKEIFIEDTQAVITIPNAWYSLNVHFEIYADTTMGEDSYVIEYVEMVLKGKQKYNQLILKAIDDMDYDIGDSILIDEYGEKIINSGLKPYIKRADAFKKKIKKMANKDNDLGIDFLDIMEEIQRKHLLGYL